MSFLKKDYFAFAKKITIANYNYARDNTNAFFVNTPLGEKIECYVNGLLFDNDKIGNLTIKSVFEIFSTTAVESFFIFDNRFYCQTDGVTIKLPLGSSIAVCYAIMKKVIKYFIY